MGNIIENGNYCVYIHTSPSGKMYVGQTSIKPEKRWRNGGAGYLSKKNGRYIQPVFAHAILKYGWDNFEHEIVASNLTKEEADNFEKLLIEKLNTKDSEYGYNLREGGSHGRHSEESRRKIGETQKGKTMSEESKKKISESLKGEKSPLYGTHPSEEARKNMSEAQKKRAREKGFSEEHRRKLSEAQRSMYKCNARKVLQYDLDGNLIKIWDSMGKAARELEISVQNIYNCCRGYSQKANGFIWKYYDDVEIIA